MVYCQERQGLYPYDCLSYPRRFPLVPSAMAQNANPAGDEEPYLPEPNAVEVSPEELAQIAGQPLPKTGGSDLGTTLVSAAALLVLSSAVLAYVVFRRGPQGGGVQ